MKKITLNTNVDAFGNITIQYKMGNWMFAWYCSASGKMHTQFAIPKYCKSLLSHEPKDEYSKPLTKYEAFSWYKHQRALFMDSIVGDRLNYYQQKFDSILTEHRRLNTV